MLWSLLLSACHAPAYISGKLEGVEKEDQKIYLIEPQALKEVAASYFGKIIDSALINADGSFEFRNTPKTKKPILLELALQQPGKAPNYFQTNNPLNSNYMPVLWQFGTSIQITAKFDAFQKSFSIDAPSEVNQDLLNLRDVNQEAYKTYLAEKEWELEEGSELMEKEHSVLQYKKELIQFSSSAKNLIPALVALRWVSPDNYYERVPEFLVSLCNKWSIEQPEHPWVKQLCRENTPAKLPVLVGDVFPNLKVPMQSKDTLILKDHLGSKLTIIDLWASWCGPCRKENRNVLVPIWDEYHNQGVQIIAYGLESDADTWKESIDRDGANRWLHASDLKGDEADFLKQIRIQTIPANFILDEKGVVVAKNIHGKLLKALVKNYVTVN